MLIHYCKSLSNQVIEIWSLFVAIINERYIPVHSLVENLDKVRYTSFVAVLILSRFDFTNKVSTKGAAIKQMYSILSLFGQSQQAKADILQQDERYIYHYLW